MMKVLFKVPRRLTYSELWMARHNDNKPLKRGAVSKTDFFYVTEVTDKRVIGFAICEYTKEKMPGDRKLLPGGKFHLYYDPSGAGPAYYLKDAVK
jgi:hypothetical protein